MPTSFEIISELRNVETIARGKGIREQKRLVRVHGLAKWRKRKGFATVRIEDGSSHDAEVHWYEGTGIGKREFKLKRLL